MERVVRECHRENNTICRFPSIPISEHGVAFNCACDARACVVLHISESLMMLCTSQMNRNLSVQWSFSSSTQKRQTDSSAHVICWRVTPQHVRWTNRHETLPQRVLTTPPVHRCGDGEVNLADVWLTITKVGARRVEPEPEEGWRVGRTANKHAGGCVRASTWTSAGSPAGTCTALSYAYSESTATEGCHGTKRNEHNKWAVVDMHKFEKCRSVCQSSTVSTQSERARAWFTQSCCPSFGGQNKCVCKARPDCMHSHHGSGAVIVCSRKTGFVYS